MYHENHLKSAAEFFQLQRCHHLYVTRLARRSEPRIADRGALGSKLLRRTCSSSCRRCRSQSTGAAAEQHSVRAGVLPHRSVMSRTACSIRSRVRSQLLPSHHMRLCRAQRRATVQSISFLLLARHGFIFLQRIQYSLHPICGAKSAFLTTSICMCLNGPRCRNS